MRLGIVLLSFALAAGAGAQLWTGSRVTVTVASGQYSVANARLDVPTNAVPQTTVFSFLPGVLAPRNPNLVAGSAITIGPSFKFKVNPTLVLFYDPNLLPTGTVESDLRLFRVEGDRWVPVSGSTVTPTANCVRGQITRTGVYGAIAGDTTQAAENRIYYRYTGLGDAQIYRSNEFGQERESLGSIFGIFTDIVVSPARNAILYGQPQPSGKYELYTASVDGSNVAKLTNGDFTAFSGAAISPDGLTLFVGGTRNGQSGVYKQTTSGWQKLSEGATTAGPSMSYDGTKYAFATGSTITLAQSTGGTIRTINAGTGDVTQVNLSPDATKIAFVKGGTVYTVPATGGTPVSVAAGLNPQWSPDSAKLVYFSTSSTTPGITRAIVTPGRIIPFRSDETLTGLPMSFFWK